MLKAGMTRVDITPPQGLELEGYPHYARNNTGAHDPLYAACMYVSNGEKEVVFVTLDLLFFSKKYTAEVRNRVNARCGIDQKNIMISCSHTHSGPCASGFIDVESIETGRKQPMEYIESIMAKITDAIVEAKEKAFDALFACNTTVCGAESGVGGNRRIPGGPHDPLVSVMAIKEKATDKVRGAMINYTLHPTFIHEWSNVCTADYPCYLKMQFEEIYPDALTGFAQGCSGNQSSRYYRQGESYDEAERVGRILGKAAVKALENAQWLDDMVMNVAVSSIEVDIRNFGTEEEVAARMAEDEANYKELYAKYGKSEKREEYYLWQNANLKLLGSQNQLGYVRLLNKGIKIEMLEEEVPAEIQIIRLGDVCVVGLQGELFVEYGLYIKGMAGFKTVIVNELSNGKLPGYLYTPESLVTGGYETDTSLIGEKFGRKLINKTLETIELVK